MIRLNPNINIEEYYNKWNNSKIVTINNLLVEEDANKLNECLLNVPEREWDVSIHPYDEKIFTFANNEENQHHISAGTITANQANDIGLFSYCFRRYDKDIGMEDFLVSPDFLQLINSITNMNVSKVFTVFASKYQADSFLSTHTDTGRGKLAFVLNLTKYWKEEDGGCFELLESNWRDVKLRIVPQFNSLTIFNVEGAGVPHRVTKVQSDVTNIRIAISGWLI